MSLLDKIEHTRLSAIADLKNVNDSAGLEKYRLKFLSRKGLLNEIFDEFKQVPGNQKGSYGKVINELKIFLQSSFDETSDKVNGLNSVTREKIDFTLPGIAYNVGSKHLITQALDEITDIFRRIGFGVYEGFEIEDEFHNFDALNTPEYHPSRDMQDTFYIKSHRQKNRYVLRTQTSPGQIRVMREHTPPIRVIVPGRVYRNEEINARSLEMFHQVEGLYVDKNVSMRELKATINYFAHEFFGKELAIRMRPSYFPFTEPSAEVDVECYLCNGNGCRICKNSGWLEIAGCGMVDPEVFKHCGYDPEQYTGYAFGFGIERTLMIKFGIPDIRMFYENDIRFLKQFKG
ncbi:MAG: phenylalanine--tRNA ligase subunit alpha [Ignavibacteriaceae bacterium]|jgi:phenylalanyl-tRNA synthetase, alpha subunit (EC 6.1.1.20)|nr:MAG: phenylalanine--tRNA ligase subunit alpha [Chlorobiota bacterium]KXK03811.1 MAG: phenylalanyl-tRNA synthetase subunit alpha [Chlorobi bacterium OLB4]MBV6398178.1 Phenylalanine--tRNA ligase alpha subunit [Ignavibacteria bacterium]MCC6885910.1 phenylalanine--tRNA ligase subunit alpha [Ignavibacteriales bacterium]MCE7953433.1 phenylalanine--tRNA ligase subunit alpha [Chlorobi bacterium CHB7]MDL1887369.1 phenylalanine--tRNA ligase subunit alpha [Ignavibacteria bacterium CHB1]MEB2330068.1 p